MLDTLLWLLTVGSGVMLWRNSMRAKELATTTCRKACTSYGVQLLDDTVSLVRISPTIGHGGGFRLRRTYEFELSETGANRRVGNITLVGDQVESIYLPNDSANLLA